MHDFYEKFYCSIAQSPVHAAFCERSFGKNLGQHGFSDIVQLEALIRVTGLHLGLRALDLGCGNGMIAEYLSDCTGAHLTGLDYIPMAIEQAQERTAPKRAQLDFFVSDINALDLPAQAFDVILSIDTMYFSNDYGRTIAQLLQALRPAGQMGIFFAHGWEPWTAVADFPKETLEPDKTPLAVALHANRLTFTVQDFTAEEYRLAQLRKQVLTELQPQFEAEDLLFIYENRMGEANGISHAIEMNLHRRYLYHLQLET
jgi:SAM-dependent methyltransferase